MRVVVETNIPVSARIIAGGKPAAIIDARPGEKLTLLICMTLADELRSTRQKPRVADLIKPCKSSAILARNCLIGRWCLDFCRSFNAL